jgi:hypothetical protein
MAVLSDRLRSLRQEAVGCKGASAVEFALVLPVLLLILFGTIEYGWYLTVQFMLSNAVTEGARVGITARQWEGEDPKQMAIDAVVSSFRLLKSGQARAFRQPVQATVNEENEPPTLEVWVKEYHYRPITGFLPQGLIPEHIGARTVMALPD